MSDTGAAIALPWDAAKTSLILNRDTTQDWPFIQPIFADGGYFPLGLTIHSPKPVASSENQQTVTGTATVYNASFATEAKFSGSGTHVELELSIMVPLASLMGSGSALTATWEPKITFRSSAGKKTIDLHAARGKVRIGKVGSVGSIELEAEVKMPGLRIEATLDCPTKSLSDFMGEYAVDGGVPGLVLENMRLHANPARGAYSLSVAAAGTWPILPNFELTAIEAHVLYASEARTAWGAVRAAAKLGSVDFEVEASYDSNVAGWQFKGGLAPDKPLDLKEFIGELVKSFKVKGGCPAALEGATIDELSVSFNTVTQTVTFCCATQLTMGGKKLDVSLVIDIGDHTLRCSGGLSVIIGSEKDAYGEVKLKKVEFDLVFDQSRENKKTLVASYTDTEPVEVKLGDLIEMVSNNADLIEQGKALTFAFKDALFVCESRGSADADWLFAADLEAGLDFSALPLIGASFAPGQGARLAFQPLLTSGGIDTAALGDMMGDGGLTLPAIQPAKGLSVTTKVSLGAEVIQLGLPVGMSDGKMVHDGGREATSPPQVSTVDNVSWIAVQKAFGPLALERVGVRYQSGALDLLLDAHLSAAGLALDLEGFGVRVKLAPPSGAPPAQVGVAATDLPPVRGDLGMQVTPVLDGIGIDFRSPTLEIGGSLLHQQVIENEKTVNEKTVDEYVGTAVLKTPTFSIDAIGSYRVVDGHPSLFVYAALDYPIGGPAFFFVTGLAAAFGYNRSFKLPPIEKLASFPLLATQAGKSLRAISDELRPYIPAELGAIFLGIGVRFTSFQTIKSSALLTASFGKDVSLDLIGRSTLTMPAGAPPEKAVALIEMAWLASYRPAEGLLALRAQLSPESYIFSKDCHLTGGFAFHSWFKGDHEGDFVLTAGGYHPGFDIASRPHYPRVPRLGVAWQVDPQLSIKGDAYYALTSSAAMAGGHLELVWEKFPYKAWCKAGIDCLFEWQPLHYVGQAYVELGASYTFELGGTRHISVEVGADLTVWGPPFSGLARVNMVLFSFDVSFGATKAEPPPVHLFDDDGKGIGAGFSALLPDPGKLCAVSVTGGLAGSIEEGGKKVWVVNAKELRIVVDSLIPAQEVHVKNMAQALPEPADAAPIAPSRFGIAPMRARHEDVKSEMTIRVTRVPETKPGEREPGLTEPGDSDSKWDHLQYRPRIKGYPSALWGEPGKGDSSDGLKGAALVQACAGVEIKTTTDAPDVGTEGEGKGGVRLYKRHLPQLGNGTYDISVVQHLSAKPHAGPHTATCCRPLVATSSLRFRVGDGPLVLPASCIHSVFPPKGSLGDHSFMLPQIVLDRSTLPWERAALIEGADKNTPWLALLLFDGEKKATVNSPDSGAPVLATIDISENELPSARQLELLCHVRVVSEPQADGTQRLVERAVVLAPRTPAPGKLSTVHLVSMNGIKKVEAGHQLVSLASWSFSCVENPGGFKALMDAVKKNSEPFAASSVRLACALESGKRAQADYHGPLVPLSWAENGKPSTAGAADANVDISQTAALELGRLLALQDKSVSVGLLRLKRGLSHQARLAGQTLGAPHLHVRSVPPVASARPSEVASEPPSVGGLPAWLQRLLTPALAAWAADLLKLEGVPFRYLLPDELLLPKESMRFFGVHEQWVTNLLMGALGVGGAWDFGLEPKGELAHFKAFADVGRGPMSAGERPFGPMPRLTGVVLRSEVVSGWPAMTVRAVVDDKTGEVWPCRLARLSKNILLALFEGTVKSVIFRLPQEALHFERKKDHPLPANWLGEAKSPGDARSLSQPKSSVDLGDWVSLADHEELACDSK